MPVDICFDLSIGAFNKLWETLGTLLNLSTIFAHGLNTNDPSTRTLKTA